MVALEPLRVFLKVFDCKVGFGKENTEWWCFKCKQMFVGFSDHGFEAAIMSLLVVF